jgi:hypothetical protein
MPYLEIVVTHTTQPKEEYALCSHEKCREAFCKMFGIPSLKELPISRDMETISVDTIFEDSHTYHANCFMCGITVWCGSDCFECGSNR